MPPSTAQLTSSSGGISTTTETAPNMVLLSSSSSSAGNNNASSSSSSSNNNGVNDKTKTQYRDNADLILDMTLDIHSSTSPERVDEQIWKIVSTLCPFLVVNKKDEEDNNDDSSDTSSSAGVTIKPLTGGLSNELFIVQTSHHPQGVLVRIHPSTPEEEENGDTNLALIDRDIENKLVAWLSSQNTATTKNNSFRAPIYYGRFTNGRVEEFYSNVKPLSCFEMSTFAIPIATQLGQFHSLQVPTTIMGIKPTLMQNTCRFKSIDNWFTSVFNKLEIKKKSKKNDKNISSSTEEKKNEEDTDVGFGGVINGTDDNDDDDIIELSKELYNEWMWLKEYLLDDNCCCGGEDGVSSTNVATTTTTSASANHFKIKNKALQFIREIVLTHQDCQSLNILKKEDYHDTSSASDDTTTNKEDLLLDMKLIDFEYAGWNPRAADIANTFCEYCDMNNLCARYEIEYPSNHDQNIFLKAYVQQVNPSLSSEIFGSASSSLEEKEETTQEEILFLSTLRQEIGRFTLLSHIGWSIWGILKKLEDCAIEYDYVEYTRHRMDGYKLFKSLYANASS